MGLINDKRSQNNKAVENYTKAIEISPDYSYAYSNRGISYGNLALWEKAIDNFTKAIEIDPTNTAAINNRELTYKMLKSERNNN